VIDLHCHALPGIDDGPADMDEAIALARAAVEAGTRTLVATPHIDHSFGIDPGSLPGRVDALRQELAAADVPIEVLVGGEIALTRVIDLDESELDVLRLGGGPYLLLEAPLSPVAGDFEAVVLGVQERGWKVVLAHPERCPALLRQPERLARLVEAGVLTQVTAGSMAGVFGRTVARSTLRWLSAGLVHIVASDAHDAYRRPPSVLGAFERAEAELPGVKTIARWLTEETPRAVLDGAQLPERPPLPEAPGERGWLGRLRPRA
jgi:protein-tyrosine phosphatase